MRLYNALIRTHHITSRKKVAKLRQAASNSHVFALLRSGGAPGIMYVEGLEQGVRDWVDAVHNLRYKDYQLAVKPAPVTRESTEGSTETEQGVLRELSTVKAFSLAMQDRQVYSWWRKGMGFQRDAF